MISVWMAWSKHGFRPIRARVRYMLFYKKNRSNTITSGEVQVLWLFTVYIKNAKNSMEKSRSEQSVKCLRMIGNVLF